MSTQTVARRYARAIFELAQEKGNLAETTRDVRSLADLYEGSTDFRELELNPAVTEADRVAVVKTIAQQLGVGEDTVRTASMLAERQRL
ncbi:MAG: F0F1 ATP synthase subunit delta, partial [Myxococcota bacterium]